MARDPSAASTPAPADPTPDTWQELEALLDEASRLAAGAPPPSEFFPAWMELVLRAVAGRSAVAWWPAANGGTSSLSSWVRCVIPAADADPEAPAPWLSVPEECWTVLGERPRARRLGPGARDEEFPSFHNPTDLVWRFLPVVVQLEVTAWLLLVTPAGDSEEAEAGADRLIEAFVETAADYRRARGAATPAPEPFLNELQGFAARVHRSLQTKECAFVAANEMRRLCAADRVTVVVRRRGNPEALAVSGCESVERRSQQVRALEELAACAMESREAVAWPGDGEPGELLAPPVVTAAERLADVGAARRITVLPSPPLDEDDTHPRLGAVVFEQFTDVWSPAQQKQADRLWAVAAVALENAWKVNRIPGARWTSSWRRSPRARRPLLRWLLLLAPILGIAALAVPVELRIRSTGVLTTRTKQHVFAPRDAEVHRLLVSHGDLVEAGDVLAELRFPDLDRDIERVLGELATTDQEYRSARASVLGRNPSTEEERAELDRQLARVDQLEERLAGLRNELEILERDLEALTLRSPVTGRVITWQVEDRLLHRPVRRGQVLFTIADVAGDWELVLEVRDHEAVHVVEAQHRRQASSQGAPPVRFVLATQPDHAYSGTVSEIAPAATATADGRTFVPVRVTVPEIHGTPRPGTRADARIACGRRALGYVWFRELLRWGQVRWNLAQPSSGE